MNINVGVNIGASASDSDWREAPQVTEEGLCGSFWTLSSLDSGEFSPFTVLAPEGRIGNFFHPSLDYWHVLNGRLCMVDTDGQPSIIFNTARIEADGTMKLAGRGKIAGINSVYILTATRHPAHPLNPTPAHVTRRADFLVSTDKPLRPNLVVVPAGAASLHGKWQENLSDSNRNWDICVGWYGEERPFLPAPVEYLAHIPKTRKFKLLYDMFYDGSPLWNYERIWLPDDDLLLSGDDINRMFHLSRKHHLDLCQPTLIKGPGSYPTHPITIQQAARGIRNEPFVEIMCPLFSKRALRICIGSFRDAESGYGLDHLWPSFLGRPLERMAMIDAIGAAHTRPVGTNYSVKTAVAEQNATFKTYGFRLKKVPGVW